MFSETEKGATVAAASVCGFDEENLTEAGPFAMASGGDRLWRLRDAAWRYAGGGVARMVVVCSALGNANGVWLGRGLMSLASWAGSRGFLANGPGKR